MKKTVLEIYALAVCFVAAVCFIISTGFASYAVVGIVSPEFTMSSWVHSQHQTNDAFWNSTDIPRVPGGSDEKSKERPTEPELTQQREASYLRAIASERRDNFQTLVKSSIVTVIDVIVFLLHWLLARRERKSAAEPLAQADPPRAA